MGAKHGFGFLDFTITTQRGMIRLLTTCAQIEAVYLIWFIAVLNPEV